MSFANAMAVLQKPFLNLPYGRDSRYRTLNAVIDASRRNDIISVTDFGTDGKLRQVKINYYPVDCDSTGSCDTNICSDGTVLEPRQRFFTLGKCVASKVYQLSVADVRKVGDSLMFSDHALTQIRSTLDSVRKQLNDEIVAWLGANVGCQPDGTEYKKIALTDANTGAILPRGLFEIERSLQDSGLVDPVIVGGGDVFAWEKGLTIGGINAQGQRIDQLATGNVYYDPKMEAFFGDTTQGHIVAFTSQALKFIAWNSNVDMFATEINTITGLELDRMYRSGDTYFFGVIVDPVTGLVWDLDIIFDPCTKMWKFQYRLNWDIFLMPEFACNLECVNGIFHFTTCLPGAITCPDPGQAPTPTAKTYEWTPDVGLYPLFVNDLTLAGQSTEPNATAADIDELVAILNDNVEGYTFIKDVATGTKIQYTGYSAISGTANAGTLEIAFAEAA